MNHSQLTEHMVFIAPYPLTRIGVLNIFTAMHLKPQIVETFEGITVIKRDTGLILVDLFSFDRNYRDLFSALRSYAPQAVLLTLLDDDSDSLRSSVLQAGADIVLNVNRADIELPAAIRRAVFRNHLPEDGKSPDYKMEVNDMEQKDESNLQKLFSRRTFLKGSGAAAAIAGVAVASPGNTVMKALADSGDTTQGSEEKINFGICRGNCTSKCRIKIKTRNGKVVQTEMGEFPDPKYNRICAKGLSHPLRVYSPERIKYPMRRVGARGAGQWEQITWDEAINEICTKWKQYQKESGKESIVFSPASGNTGVLNNANALMALLGASSLALCYDAAGEAACHKAVGFGPWLFGNSTGAILEGKTFILWGHNATESRPLDFYLYKEAQKKGAKLISVDPVYNITASKCDWHIPIRPGTDAALLLAMIKICIDKEWVDEAFLRQGTVGSYLVKDTDKKFLRRSDLEPGAANGTDIIVIDAEGKAGAANEIKAPVLTGSYEIKGIKVTPSYQLLVDSVQEWTVERAAKLCDIPTEDIIELTRIFATEGPSMMCAGFGPDHYAGGHHVYHAMAALLAVTGQIGKPGAGFGGILTPYFSPLSANLKAGSVPGKPGPSIGNLFLYDVMEKKAFGDIPIELRSIYIYRHNAVSNISERNKTLKALDKMDLIVAADIEMNDTTRYADIVLPVAHWFEYEDFCTSYAPYFVLQEKVQNPLYESKTDYEINQMIAKGMGVFEHMSWSPEEYLADCLSSPMAKAAGFSLEKLRQDKVLDELKGKDFIHGENGVFPTPTGKLEFYIENATTHIVIWEGMGNGEKFDESLEHLPSYETPYEAWTESVDQYPKNPLAEKYPLIYTSQRNRFFTHTQFHNIEWFKEIYPEPTLRMNPDDAAARDIKEGDIVKVYNDRGHVVLKVQIHNGIRPGMVVYPKGYQSYQFIDGHISDLTSTYTHPACYNNYYFDALCQVVKN